MYLFIDENDEILLVFQLLLLMTQKTMCAIHVVYYLNHAAVKWNRIFSSLKILQNNRDAHKLYE